MSAEPQAESTDEINGICPVCPHCGYEHARDHHYEGTHKFECWQCEALFKIEVRPAAYRSSKIEEAKQ